MRFARGVHLEGDFFRRCIVAGGEGVTPQPSPESLRQLQLRYQLAASAADAYFDHGFAVVVEDVVAGPFLSEYGSLIKSRPRQPVVLMPSRDVVARRDQRREAKGYGDWSVDQLYDLFARDTPRLGIWLDSSDLTPDETVDEILRRVATTHNSK